ncbi:acyl-CoA reductase [Mycobacterium szulgai]|uniref:Acyl-CoA reductase n=1 Tax=Mycobacterium szulgai TaxID=1787 RepID=A0A1X2FCP6_MYCSZ|nr:acyl-CoA reductase [Mycobacterium szulgai]MCV7075402.1 acyl-CoA reductase [Mycobacterium szulgai]ORX16223.1 hypothetical protein AWC27_01125 [Mycobacterium szulgai]
MSETATLATSSVISHLPAWLAAPDIERVRVPHHEHGYDVDRPRLSSWPEVGRRLRAATANLRTVKITTIVEAIDAVATQWCDRRWPVRRAARDAVVAATGLSVETVERSFDVELRNYRAASLWAVLRRELGNPQVLDDFCLDGDLGGRTMAVGPGLTCHVMTGNVPGLPALSVVRALLVKSASVVKVASSEPTFAARFVETLARVQPLFGDAIVVTYWDQTETAVRDAVLAEADTVIAYGGDESCAAIHARMRLDQRFIAHNHKFSVGLLTRGYLATKGMAETAEQVARDASMFDQHACIAAQAYLVEGGIEAGTLFAESVAQAMRRYAATCPLGRPDRAAVAARRMRWVDRQYWAAQSAQRRVWTSADGLVSIDDALADSAGGDRTLQIVAVPSVDGMLDALRPYGSYLQNVAVGAVDSEMRTLAPALARLGATRLCAPGRMPDPSLIWKHDGRACVAELVVWCDAEMHPWASIEY